MRVLVTRLSTSKPDRLMLGEKIEGELFAAPRVSWPVTLFTGVDGTVFWQTTEVQEVNGQSFTTRNSVYRWEEIT